MDPPILISEPLQYEPWYKQHTRIIEEVTKYERPIEKMSIAEIAEMYEKREFLCDSCGKILRGKDKCTLKEHILHLIDPFYEWCCEDCFQQDLRKGRIVAIQEVST